MSRRMRFVRWLPMADDPLRQARRPRLHLLVACTALSLAAGCATADTTTPTDLGLASPTGGLASPPAASPPAVASSSPASTATVAASRPVATTFPLVTFPDAPTTSLPQVADHRLQAVLDEAVAGTGLGISAAIIDGDHGTWAGDAGDDPFGNALTPDMRWYTGSIAKTVVAAEIQRLVERGKLDLDAAAADVIGADRQVETNGATVRDLLRMRSGLTSGVPAGTKWEYSNGDYVLLGHVIESVEGRPLGDVLTSDILDVAGAEGLTFPKNGSVANAAGSLETDATSLARWGYELFGGRLLQPASLSRMVEFDENDYGMGVFGNLTAYHGRPLAGHLGQDGRWSAALTVLPEQRRVIVTLMDSADVDRTYQLSLDLADALGQ